jgi:hypothetical protein
MRSTPCVKGSSHVNLFRFWRSMLNNNEYILKIVDLKFAYFKVEYTFNHATLASKR